MGILDFLRKKKKVEQNRITQSKSTLPNVTMTDEQVNAILEEEIKTFFPDQGCWSSDCFRQSNEVSYENLPCHLRNNAWLSSLLKDVMDRKGIHMPRHTIKNFIDNSKDFEKLRHAYELRIVEWQINWIKNDGENWIFPEGYDELALSLSEDVDIIIRGGVSRTLQAIGMNKDVIEEGLEKFADSWRHAAMLIGFEHLYEPFMFRKGNPSPASEDHLNNWLADREYKYYKSHKNSVDKYGVATPAMRMTPEEHAKLLQVLNKQNFKRIRYLEAWKQNPFKNSERHTIYSEEDSLNK